MLSMFSPVSLEAQKLISVSIGKINASRVTRTGTSLHRSLLVASVLHKARNVYIEEERERASRFPYCPSSPELTVTPVCQNVTVTPVCQNVTVTPVCQDVANNCEIAQNVITEPDCRMTPHEDEVVTPDNGEESKLPLSEANTENNITCTTNTTTTVTAVTNTSTVTTTSTNNSHNRIRKRRRVSDQETAAAISSILPKRLRSELKEVSPGDCNESLENSSCYSDCSQNDRLQSSDIIDDDSSKGKEELSSRLSPTQEEQEDIRVPSPDSETSIPSASDDSDSDSDDAVSDTSSSSCEEMEVDQLTSLVSYFSFSQSQQKSDFCLSPLHNQTGPHVVALTA